VEVTKRQLKRIINEISNTPTFQEWVDENDLVIDIDPLTGDEVALISDEFAMRQGIPDGVDWNIERSHDDDGWIVSEFADDYLWERNVRITRKQIRKIIKEYYEKELPDWHIDGQPWSGSLEDFAKVQAKTFGHGELANPEVHQKDIDTARKMSKASRRNKQS
tara:strand:+ start:323 stop:811 length:489 start_codon:yes stop_codon:yes gene_type:complete